MSRHRRKRSDEVDELAGRRRQRREGRPHGWSRSDDLGARSLPGRLIRLRRPSGTPLLVFTVLAVLTFVGLARVHVRTQVLELGQEITELTEEQARLLNRKRRLQTERAYLRHPGRVREYASTELGMKAAPADRIQRIQLSAPPPQKDPKPQGKAGSKPGQKRKQPR